mmetsp:Transcript_4942/g.3556  ORF Transcript_4942/g.3556 Transcript_4942/m.3556 type:complete len:98 (-) Transcript_4942:360-653(-)
MGITKLCDFAHGMKLGTKVKVEGNSYELSEYVAGIKLGWKECTVEGGDRFGLKRVEGDARVYSEFYIGGGRAKVERKVLERGRWELDGNKESWWRNG